MGGRVWALPPKHSQPEGEIGNKNRSCDEMKGEKEEERDH